MKEFCKGKDPYDLLFPNGIGGVEYHFPRRCEKIAKRAGLNWKDFDLHRWRRTGATRHMKRASLSGRSKLGLVTKAWR